MGLGLVKSVIVKPEEQKFLKDDILLKREKKISKPVVLSMKKDKTKNIQRGSDIDIFKNRTSYGTGFKVKSLDLTKKLKPEEKPLSKTTKGLNISKFKTTFSDFNNFFKNEKPNNILHKTILSLNRNNLYAEKFAHKSFYNQKDKDKDKDKENNNKFPSIRSKYLKEKLKYSKINNNLNFEARKRTDDLIRTQFYFSNYKNFVKINPNSSDFSSSKSMSYNQKNIWNEIKSFTKNIIAKEEKKRKSFNFNKNYKKLYKSKSATDIKST